jgi:hypothetical protein
MNYLTCLCILLHVIGVLICTRAIVRAIRDAVGCEINGDVIAGGPFSAVECDTTNILGNVYGGPGCPRFPGHVAVQLREVEQ